MWDLSSSYSMKHGLVLHNIILTIGFGFATRKWGKLLGGIVDIVQMHCKGSDRLRCKFYFQKDVDEFEIELKTC